MRREVSAFLQPALQAKDYAGAFSALRQFKQRELLRIAARDLARLGDAPQITRELSDVADVTLDATLQLCRQQLVERLGTPCHPDADGAWQPQMVIDYRRQAPHAQLMHPTDEHLLPFFVAAGAAGRQPALRVHASLTHGDLGMDAYAFGAGAAALRKTFAGTDR